MEDKKMKNFLILIIEVVLLNIVTLSFAQELKPSLPVAGEREERFFDEHERGRIPLPERPLTPELEKRILAIITEREPEEVDHLLELKEINPAEYHEILLRTWREQQILERLKKEDPKKYEQVKRRQQLERITRKLAREYRESDNEKRQQEIKQELRKKLDELFDLRETEREAEIVRLEKELDKMRKIVKERKTKKEEIVVNHLNKLLGVKEYLEW